MITAWRIVKRKRAGAAFTGQGARLYGGRWNRAGIAIVYTDKSQSRAALERVVQLESSELLDNPKTRDRQAVSFWIRSSFGALSLNQIVLKPSAIESG